MASNGKFNVAMLIPATLTAKPRTKFSVAVRVTSALSGVVMAKLVGV